MCLEEGYDIFASAVKSFVYKFNKKTELSPKYNLNQNS